MSWWHGSWYGNSDWHSRWDWEDDWRQSWNPGAGLLKRGVRKALSKVLATAVVALPDRALTQDRAKVVALPDLRPVQAPHQFSRQTVQMNRMINTYMLRCHSLKDDWPPNSYAQVQEEIVKMGCHISTTPLSQVDRTHLERGRQ